jgi:hypothetical protein
MLAAAVPFGNWLEMLPIKVPPPERASEPLTLSNEKLVPTGSSSMHTELPAQLSMSDEPLLAVNTPPE